MIALADRRTLAQDIQIARDAGDSYRELTPSLLPMRSHVNLIPAVNSYPKLLPLSTHSKQGRVLS